MTRLARLLLAAMLALGGGATIATAADLVAVSVSDPGICSHDRVLNRITSRFGHQVRHVPNLPQVGIVDFYGISETRYLPQREDRPIDRRYCHATVALSDGYNRDLWYLIEKPMGFVGFGSNVEFCVAGFDRWYVHGAHCQAIR